MLSMKFAPLNYRWINRPLFEADKSPDCQPGRFRSEAEHANAGPWPASLAQGLFVGLSALATLLLPLGSSGWGQDAGWITFEKCSVVERKLEIPSQERGFIKTLKVELNQAVVAEQVLAELDTELAEIELSMAKLENSHAAELALDDADVRYQKVALQKVEEELASYRGISTSVSESEIRRLTLGVEQAKLGVIRATHAQRRAAAEAQLKSAAVQAAELRLARRRTAAPINGVITAVNIHPGQAVEAGQTLLEIQDLEHLMIDRMIPIGDFNLAELVDAEVRVDVQRDGQMVRLSGQITSYDPRVSAGGMIRIHARVTNLRHQNVWVLHPGRDVTMHVARVAGNNRDQAKASVRPLNLR